MGSDPGGTEQIYQIFVWIMGMQNDLGEGILIHCQELLQKLFEDRVRVLK